jgi:hypothetical protein
MGDFDPGRLVWAERESRRLLEPLGARWLHTLGVVQRAQEVGRTLADGEADVLVAAAYLHDVGYAAELRETGFHPLDGARFVRRCGYERLAGLVAFHSSAAAEAAERGLERELSEFVNERSAVSRALSYCDLTTDSEGRPATPLERVRDVRERYAPDSPERRALERAMPGLLEDARIVESMLATTSMKLAPAAPGGPR